MKLLTITGALALLTPACLDLGTQPWTPGGVEEEPPPDVGGEPGARPDDASGGELPSGDEVPSGDGAEGDGSDDPSDASCPHPAGVAETVEVLLVHNAFHPPEVWICAGDSVTWTNQDTKEHTIFSGKPYAPDGHIQSQQLYFGATFTWAFAEPGSHEYYCSTHKKKMQGAWVHVE